MRPLAWRRTMWKPVCYAAKYAKMRASMTWRLRDYQEAVKAESDNPEALNNLAWLLAAAPEARLRDGRRAVEAAARAVQLEDAKDWNTIDTLAAAFAETGKFSESIRCRQQALKIAPTEERPELEARLKLYSAKQPFRLPVKTASP